VKTASVIISMDLTFVMSVPDFDQAGCKKVEAEATLIKRRLVEAIAEVQKTLVDSKPNLEFEGVRAYEFPTADGEECEFFYES
jgi:hypothetical protein